MKEATVNGDIVGVGILLYLLLVIFVTYWVIRLAVRHGVMDAQRRGGGR
jgi:hypothetical protein